MGRQIQVLLTDADEERLVTHIVARYPRVRVVDRIYPPVWDRTVTLTAGTRSSLIIDERVVDLLVQSSNRTSSGEWQIRSRAGVCIEWDRDVAYGPRLYMGTGQDPLTEAVSAAIGKDVERIFNMACRWIKAHCVQQVNQTGPRGLWLTRGGERALLKARDDRRASVSRAFAEAAKEVPRR